MWFPLAPLWSIAKWGVVHTHKEALFSHSMAGGWVSITAGFIPEGTIDFGLVTFAWHISQLRCVILSLGRTQHSLLPHPLYPCIPLSWILQCRNNCFHRLSHILYDICVCTQHPFQQEAFPYSATVLQQTPWRRVYSPCRYKKLKQHL